MELRRVNVIYGKNDLVKSIERRLRLEFLLRLNELTVSQNVSCTTSNHILVICVMCKHSLNIPSRLQDSRAHVNLMEAIWSATPLKLPAYLAREHMFTHSPWSAFPGLTSPGPKHAVTAVFDAKTARTASNRKFVMFGDIIGANCA